MSPIMLKSSIPMDLAVEPDTADATPPS